MLHRALRPDARLPRPRFGAAALMTAEEAEVRFGARFHEVLCRDPRSAEPRVLVIPIRDHPPC